MAYNGSGTFVPLTAPTFPAVDGTVIVAAYYNAVIADLISGLNKALCRDGQAIPTANLQMGGFKLTGMGTATANGDAVEYAQYTTALSGLATQIADLLANLTVTNSAVLPANTTIGTVSPTELSYLDGLTGNIEALFARRASPEFTGTPRAPTPASTINTDQIATMAAVQAVAMNSALPNQAGQVGKYLRTNGTDGYWDAIVASLVVSSRTSNTALGALDQGTIVDITSGTFNQTVGNPVTLGNGWWTYLRNSGTGTITLTPTSGTVDGLASFKMYSNEMRLLYSDGTTLKSIVITPFERTWTASETFTKPPGYASFAYQLMAGGSGGCGGGGGGNVTGGLAGGGGGGGASGVCGNIITGVIASRYLAATGNIVVGAGGTGGAGGTLNSGGLVGTSGGASSFYFITSGTTSLTNGGGSPGFYGGGGGTAGPGGTLAKTTTASTSYSVTQQYVQQATGEGNGTAGGSSGGGATGGTGGAGKVGAASEILNPGAGGTAGAGVAATVNGNNGGNAAANTGAGGGGGSGAGGQNPGPVGTCTGGSGGNGGSGIVIIQGLI